MKQIHVTLALIFGIYAAMFIISSPVLADKTYTGNTIKGTYYVLATETRNEGGVILHCETHGIVNVYANGTIEVCGPTMCNGVPGTLEPGYNTYVITGDEILVTEVGATDSSHCKILDNGRMMLCDGGQRTIAELWTWAGTVVKMNKTPDPNMLVSEGCLP